MEAFLHQVFAGLATGGIYASLALALVMIHNATRLVNFAQGEMAMCSTYLCWSMIQAGWPYWGAFFATVALSLVFGAAIERILIRPVERAPVLTVVVVFIGLLLALNSLAGWIYSYTIKSFPSPFPSEAPFGLHVVSAHELGAIGVTLTVLILVYLFFRFTPLGLAMRAAAQNPDGTRVRSAAACSRNEPGCGGPLRARASDCAAARHTTPLLMPIPVARARCGR